MEEQRWIERLAPLTFYSFLVHTVVLDVLTFVIPFPSVEGAAVYIPVCSAAVFGLSLLVAYFYLRVYNWADHKFGIVDTLWDRIAQQKNTAGERTGGNGML